MSDNGDSIISAKLVRDLRQIAMRGTTVRELTEVIQQRLGCAPLFPIPVLAAFARAFRVPLIKVLPIREWLGTVQDDEIDRLILPEIAKTKEQWASAEALVSE